MPITVGYILVWNANIEFVSLTTVSTSVASTLSAADLASSVASAAVGDGGDASSADVIISQVSTIESSIPSGLSVDQLQAALTSVVCAGNSDCAVSTARRRLLGGTSSVHVRQGRLLQTTASFTVTQSFNASSDVSLAAPTVDAAAVARHPRAHLTGADHRPLPPAAAPGRASLVG